MKKLLTILPVFFAAAAFAIESPIAKNTTISANDSAASLIVNNGVSLTINNNAVLNLTNTSPYQFKLAWNSSLTLDNGGSLLIGDTSVVGGSGEMAGLQSENATITVMEDAGAITVGKIYCSSGTTTFNLYKENAFVQSNLKPTKIMVTNPTTINLYASQKSILDIRTTTISAALNLNFHNNAVMTYTDSAIVYSGRTSYICLTDFSDNGILFGSASGLISYSMGEDNTMTLTSGGSSMNVIFRGENGKVLDKLTLNDVVVDGVSYKALAFAVPEPAEWAAIFGACALALAFWRKRK